MTLPAVSDLLATWPGWATMDLRFQNEFSGLNDGTALVKNLAPTLWTLTATSKTLKPSVYREWKARLAVMEGGIRPFYGRDLSARYPIAYPRGSWPTGGGFDGLSAAVAGLDAGDAHLLQVDGLPAGFRLSVGDLLGVPGRNALLQVSEAATADNTGLTPYFAVEPQIPEAVAVDDTVIVKNPYCLMRVMPGSVQASDGLNGYGTIAFQGIQIVDAP